MSDESPKFAQQEEAKDEVEGHVGKFTATDDGGEENEVEAHSSKLMNKSDHHRAL